MDTLDFELSGASTFIFMRLSLMDSLFARESTLLRISREQVLISRATILLNFRASSFPSSDCRSCVWGRVSFCFLTHFRQANYSHLQLADQPPLSPSYEFPYLSARFRFPAHEHEIVQGRRSDLSRRHENVLTEQIPQEDLNLPRFTEEILELLRQNSFCSERSYE